MPVMLGAEVKDANDARNTENARYAGDARCKLMLAGALQTPPTCLDMVELAECCQLPALGEAPVHGGVELEDGNGLYASGRG